jgi:hypothetical protein
MDIQSILIHLKEIQEEAEKNRFHPNFFIGKEYVNVSGMLLEAMRSLEKIQEIEEYVYALDYTGAPYKIESNTEKEEEKMNKTECCEFCLKYRKVEALKRVEIDGRIHFVCLDCERLIQDSPYANEKESEK